MSPPHPWLSVLVPFYRVEPYLRECVESVLAQVVGLQARLVREQLVVHLPEPPLAVGGLRRDGREGRAGRRVVALADAEEARTLFESLGPQSRNVERKPCGTASTPILRITALTLMSDSMRPVALGNTRAEPAMRGRAPSSARAAASWRAPCKRPWASLAVC